MILVLPSLIRDTEFTTADKSVDTEHTHESGHTQARTDDRRYKKPWLTGQLFTIDEIYDDYACLHDTVTRCTCVISRQSVQR